MMKIGEFASVYKVSERHVRRLIKKYESELVGHCVQQGNKGTFLDDAGVEILKGKLRTQFDIVSEGATSDRERQLESTITQLSLKYAEAMERIAENAGAVALLEAAKDNVEKLEVRVSEANERAEQAERQAAAAIQRKLETELALEEAEERARTAEDIAEAEAQEAARANEKAASLEAELEALKKRGFWARVFNK